MNKNIINLIGYCLIMLLFPCNGHAEISGLIFTDKGTKTIVRVVKITDGDTIGVKSEDGATITVRLLGINTPETTMNKNEPFGTVATDFTTTLLNKTIDLWISVNQLQENDIYKRKLGVIVESGEIFNTKLLEQGLATRLFMNNDMLNFPAWEDLEVKARQSNIGLWTNINSKGVIINEINPDPKGSDSNSSIKAREFAELYNTNPFSINIGSWSYGSDEQAIIPQGTIIPAYGYLILARTDTTNFRLLFPKTPESTIIINTTKLPIQATLQFANRYNPPQGLVHYLKDDQKGYQDSLVYNLNWDENGAQDTDKTLERINPRMKNIGDSKVNGLDDQNWSPSLMSNGTPGRANSRAILLVDFGCNNSQEPDGIIDLEDLKWFAFYWNNNNLLGDIAGTPDTTTGDFPNIHTKPDGRIDFEDLVVFARMWNWCF